MKEMDNNELDALINASLDGSLSEAEQLSQWIEESSDARKRYWELASVHGMIEQSMQSASLKAATGEQPVTPARADGLSRWRRITSVAAGVAIGVLSASLVWAYTIPLVNQERRESREIVFESFENAEVKFPGRFPAIANQWSGSLASVAREDTMSAVSGARVGQFSMLANSKSKLTYARYLIDLDEHPRTSDEHIRSVEVEAYFFTSNPKERSAFQIRLAAFSQEPAEIRPIWNDHELLFDTVLQHVGRNYVTKANGQTGWHKLRTTIEIPPGTRTVVVSLGAGNHKPGAATSDHFVDAVRVHLVDSFDSID